MSVWLDRMAPLLFDAFLASAALTSAFAAILLTSLQPARRIALARTAILGTLAIVPLTMIAPWHRFHIIHPTKRSNRLHHFFSRRISKSSTKQTQRSDHEVNAAISADEGAAPPDDQEHEPVSVFSSWPVRFLVVSYVSVVGLCLVWEGLAHLGVWWLLRTSDPPSARTMQIFDSLRHEAGGPSDPVSRVGLRVSGYVTRPVLVALLRPSILLPLHFDSAETCEELGIDLPSDELLRLTLLHELAHASRHDPAFQFLGGIAQSVWFCLPQLRWIRAQLRLDQEFLADHVASRAYGTSSQYAASLLDLAASHTRHHLDLPDLMERASQAARTSVAAVSDAGTSLGQRLRMLLECPFRLESNVPRPWLWGLRAVGFAATLFLADISLDLPDLWMNSPPFQSMVADSFAFAGESPFHVNEIVVPPAETKITAGRLPQHFRMTVDVRASSSRLGRIRLLHLPLAPVETQPDHSNLRADDPSVPRMSETTGDRVLWHKVQIERNDHGVSLSVDQHPVPCPSQLTDSSITVESLLDAPVELHDLTITPTS